MVSINPGKIIPVPFPNMVLNAHNAPGEEYQMLFTWKVPQSTNVSQMIARIANDAKTSKIAFGKGLETLIFNAHGKPGKICIGQGITRNDVTEFRKLKGLVKRIWIVACKVAKIKAAGTITDGNWFCYRLAQESGAYIKASSVNQVAYHKVYLIDFVPPGCIDSMEPPVIRWTPKGARY